MRFVKRICVFCGSAVGARPAYAEAARALAAELVRRRIGLVYGGGQVGLMGVVADAVLAGGGEAIGVIPRPLATKELAHPGLSEMHVVESMHERKATMAALADGRRYRGSGSGSTRREAQACDDTVAQGCTWAGPG